MIPSGRLIFGSIMRPMAPVTRHLIALVLVALPVKQAGAAIVYSGLLNTSIPTDFNGVDVNINGGVLNLFFGGVGVANNDLIQPFRDGTVNTDTLLNFSVGTTIDASTLSLSSGYGGSQDHLGSTFTAGQEGYIGFVINGVNYGWMRVIFTNNEGGAMVVEWAYDDSSSNPVVVGGVRQVGQNILLTAGFTLNTQLADVGGATNVVKSGSNLSTLTGANVYTGSTTISEGTLALASGASLANTSSVTVQSGATLAGLGSIAGPTTFQSGSFHSPGSSIGTQTFTNQLNYNSGSTLTWQLTGNTTSNRGSAYDAIDVTGFLNIASGVTSNLVFNGSGSTVDWADAFWDSNHSWMVYDNSNSPTLTSGSIFDTVYVTNDSLGQSFTLTGGYFSWNTSGNDVYLVYTVPEPGAAALICTFGSLLLFRRRRTRA